MRKWLALGLLILPLAVCGTGCGQGKTPEEIEAAKYPTTPPLTEEEKAKAAQLATNQPLPTDSKAPQ